MYAGHFAAGLILKTQEPRVPTWVLLIGTGFLDILFGVFVPMGIERATMVPGSSPGFRLDYIDWSHSLVMSIVWALTFGAFFLKRGTRIAVFAGAAVFSHFVLDVFMHPPIWRFGPAHNCILDWTCGIASQPAGGGLSWGS